MFGYNSFGSLYFAQGYVNTDEEISFRGFGSIFMFSRPSYAKIYTIKSDEVLLGTGSVTHKEY